MNFRLLDAYFITILKYLFFFQTTPAAFKLPSTPDSEYIPELLNTPDRDEIKSLNQYLRSQQHHNGSHKMSALSAALSAAGHHHPHHHQPLVSNTNTTTNHNAASPRPFIIAAVSSQQSIRSSGLTTPTSGQTPLNKSFTTPDSSQTDSDDVSPQIQRKRRTTHSHARDILPRFSISIEDEYSG